MYIQYNMNQLVLPMDVEIMIPEKHLCRIVDIAVEKLVPICLLLYFRVEVIPLIIPK